MLFILSLFIVSSVSVFGELAELETKQAISNIKYFTSDGKITYYQGASGSLFLTQNFKSTKLLEGSKDTKFELYASEKKSFLLISEDNSYYGKMKVLKPLDIYMTPLGSTKLEKFAQGAYPKLLLQDRFVSYLSGDHSNIHFKSTDGTRKFSIPLIKHKRPYFIPEVLMLSEHDIIFNDVAENNKGVLLHYSTIEKSSDRLHQAFTPYADIEMCKNEQFLLFMEKTHAKAKVKTRLYRIPLFNNPGFAKKELIYQSRQADLGSLICTTSAVYFIKTISHDDSLNSHKTSVAKVDIETSKLATLDTKLNPTNLIKMDQTILSAVNEKVYLVEGKNNLKESDLIKRNP